MVGILLVCFYALLLISKYWYADFLYAKGKELNDTAEPFLAEAYLRSAIKTNPFPALYYDELSAALASQSISWFESGDKNKANVLANESILQSERALEESPGDVSLKKSQAALFIKLSEENSEFLTEAARVFGEATLLAPTDAKIHYNLALSLARLGKTDEAISVLDKTIQLKADYRDARFALALLLLQKGQNQDAKGQLKYILENINSEDPLVEQQLEEIP
jgi:tetratricopeptide (TPR) repeat protein